MLFHFVLTKISHSMCRSPTVMRAFWLLAKFLSSDSSDRVTMARGTDHFVVTLPGVPGAPGAPSLNVSVFVFCLI